MKKLGLAALALIALLVAGCNKKPANEPVAGVVVISVQGHVVDVVGTGVYSSAKACEGDIKSVASQNAAAAQGLDITFACVPNSQFHSVK